MEKVKRLKYRIYYSGKDITPDLQGHVMGITYTDNVDGKADELTLKVDDSKGLWRYRWRPDKGDTLELLFGYDGTMASSGSYNIDELEMGGPPDTVTLKCISVPIGSPLRTERSQPHENKTIKQVVESVAERHGLTVVGDFGREIVLEKLMQHRESDLSFLAKLAVKYGYVFNIRGSQLNFFSIYDLEASDSVTIISRSDLNSYNVRDKSHGVYLSASSTYRNPDDEGEIDVEIDGDADEPTADILEVRERVENDEQGEVVANSSLHHANTEAVKGTFTIEGNPLILAGSNIELRRMGRVSGIWHLLTTTHRVTTGGYTTAFDAKKVGEISESLW